MAVSTLKAATRLQETGGTTWKNSGGRDTRICVGEGYEGTYTLTVETKGNSALSLKDVDTGKNRLLISGRATDPAFWRSVFAEFKKRDDHGPSYAQLCSLLIGV
jgi:hypothetical protein